MTLGGTMHPSGYTDGFARAHLPPPEAWPQLVFNLPELHYPDRLNAAAFLLSPMGRGITGEILHVDAGYHVVGMKNPSAPDISVSGKD